MASDNQSSGNLHIILKMFGILKDINDTDTGPKLLIVDAKERCIIPSSQAEEGRGPAYSMGVDE